MFSYLTERCVMIWSGSLCYKIGVGLDGLEMGLYLLICLESLINPAKDKVKGVI